MQSSASSFWSLLSAQAGFWVTVTFRKRPDLMRPASLDITTGPAAREVWLLSLQNCSILLFASLRATLPLSSLLKPQVRSSRKQSNERDV